MAVFIIMAMDGVVEVLSSERLGAAGVAVYAELAAICHEQMTCPPLVQYSYSRILYCSWIVRWHWGRRRKGHDGRGENNPRKRRGRGELHFSWVQWFRLYAAGSAIGVRTVPLGPILLRIVS